MKDTALFEIELHPGHYLFHPCSPIQTSAVRFAKPTGIRLGITAFKLEVDALLGCAGAYKEKYRLKIFKLEL